MKTLIIPDVHEKFQTLQAILAKHEDQVDHVLFLGDFFDSWDGVTENTHLTANWLKDNIGNSKYTFLFGNHDLYYAYPMDGLKGSGYSATRQKIVDGILKPEHWNQFKLIHWVGHGDKAWLCSHAGLHPYLMPTVEHKNDKDWMAVCEKSALQNLSAGKLHSWVLAGRGRGGPALVGGVTWLDWNKEFRPIPGLNQIVGHTEGGTPRQKNSEGIVEPSFNLCLDTNLQDIGIAYDFTIQLISVA